QPTIYIRKSLNRLLHAFHTAPASSSVSYQNTKSTQKADKIGPSGTISRHPMSCGLVPRYPHSLLPGILTAYALRDESRGPSPDVRFLVFQGQFADPARISTFFERFRIFPSTFTP
ncbi:MAG: hypothetical protein ACYS74_15715, partial [Planctomycetota bacterium]